MLLGQALRVDFLCQQRPIRSKPSAPKICLMQGLDRTSRFAIFRASEPK